jgi:hypothetical protein
MTTQTTHPSPTLTTTPTTNHDMLLRTKELLDQAGNVRLMKLEGRHDDARPIAIRLAGELLQHRANHKPAMILRSGDQMLHVAARMYLVADDEDGAVRCQDLVISEEKKEEVAREIRKHFRH